MSDFAKDTNVPTNDCISRQAAIDAINHICPVNTEYDCTLLDRVDVRYVLSDLPSAQAERPKGKWIPHSEKSREYIGTVLVNIEYDYFVCDTCGYPVKKGQTIYNFCPNCGAKMEVTE